MSALTEYPWPSPVEVYASTNKFMKFAIARNADSFQPWLTSYQGLTQQVNNLPAIDWHEIEFLPVRKAMADWATLLFTERTRFGLLPTKVSWAPRKMWNGTAWVAAYPPSDSDARRIGAVETADCSSLNTVGRLADLLAWFPLNAAVMTDCTQWANAIIQINSGTNQYGHRSSWSTWTFFNFVHAGPKDGAVASASDPFETQLIWSLEGLPDSWWVHAGDYGRVADSLVRLSHLTGDPTFANVAQAIVQGIWQTRLNHASYLVPDTFTPIGPVPGDQDTTTFQYMYDTDGIYWANALYRICHVVGPKGTVLIPSPDPIVWSDRVALRRDLITAYLNGPNTTFPETYLAHALAITIDWIKGAWDDSFRHFRRKLHHDGTPAAIVTSLYGDGKYNTLRMLVGAYWFTADAFYLELFEKAWDGLLSIVAAGTPAPPVFDHDIMPKAVQSGSLVSPPRSDSAQDIFLSLIVEAYRATVKLGAPRQGLLDRAEKLAGRVMDLYNTNSGYALFMAHDGIIGSAYLALARSYGTLRRIGINLSTPSQELTFTSPFIDTLVLTVNQTRAVVYMDDGTYQIASDKPGTVPITYTVTADADIAIF